ncbi:MAG: hypothetical protein Faunusvirus67_1, partial [Faunusvirus sp.]
MSSQSKSTGCMLYESGGGDITIKLADNEEIKVFSVVLKTMSPVLKATLDNDMKEKKDNEIDMTKYNSVAVKSVIRYIHCQDILNLGELNINTCLEIAYIADMYTIQDICTYITSHVDKLISGDVISVLKLCAKHRELTFANNIYLRCMDRLVSIFKSKIQLDVMHAKYCCEHCDPKSLKPTYEDYKIYGRTPCICYNLKSLLTKHKIPLHIVSQKTYLGDTKNAYDYNLDSRMASYEDNYTEMCCSHGKTKYGVYKDIVNKLYI